MRINLTIVFLLLLISACIDNGTELPCLGSADEIFEQYNFDEQNLGVDFLAMTSLFVIFHVLAYLILWFRVRKM